MPVELRLPQLGESAASAKLAVWLKQEGEPVKAGEPIVEVETDKTNVELEAPASGVVQKIHVAAGTDGLEAGRLLAVIAEEGEVNAGAAQAGTDGTGEAAGAPSPRPSPPLSGGEGGRRPGEGVSSVPDAKPQVGEPRAHATDVAATPLARRMAAAAGFELGEIRGTGPEGRIGKSDVERAIRDRVGSAQPPSPRPSPRPGEREPEGRVRGWSELAAPAFHEQPLSAMRRVTATRLQQAKQTVPHFYLRIECSAGALLEFKTRINAHSSDLKLTITDIIVRAAALALRKVPLANSTWADNAVRVYESADIAVAVNTPTGLITPIVRDAARKGLAAISRELKALTERAREGKLKPEEYTGGTFTVSNLGMYGVDSLYAIINPPQSCILGVGAAVRRPVVRGDEVTIGTVMTCTLSADHRAIDGATGAELLAELRDLIEQPGLLAL